MEISENALMMSVQAVHYAIQKLGAERELLSGPEQASYDDIIESYQIVAAELHAVYEKARRQGYDLPVFAQIVGT